MSFTLSDPMLFPQDDYNLVEVPCSHCDGTGEMIEDDRVVACRECDGDGFILITKREE
jgi:DnaJ-class molecular chaperone